MLSSQNRKILSYLAGNNSIEEKILDVQIQKYKLKFNISTSTYEEKIFPSNLIQFINTFKENTMIIYEALLSDRKILFVGDANTSCEKMSNFIFSTVSLFPVFGILKRIHPYKNLYDLDFLKSSNCIYAVTNPIFKNKTDYWDIMCEVDSGKVTLSEKLKSHMNNINRESDLMFIREIIYKINNEGMTEYEAERYFRIYTNHIFRLTGDEYFIDDMELSSEISRQNNRKLILQTTNAWKIDNEMNKIKNAISWNGKSFRQVISHINSLNQRKSIDYKELANIYMDILRFISNDNLIDIVLI